jgi:hypothetical protein
MEVPMDLAHVTDRVESIENIFKNSPPLSGQMPLRFDSGVVMYPPKHKCKDCGEIIAPLYARGHVEHPIPGKQAIVNSVLHCTSCDSFHFDVYSVKNRWNGIDVMDQVSGNSAEPDIQKIRMPFFSSVWQALKQRKTK